MMLPLHSHGPRTVADIREIRVRSLHSRHCCPCQITKTHPQPKAGDNHVIPSQCSSASRSCGLYLRFSGQSINPNRIACENPTGECWHPTSLKTWSTRRCWRPLLDAGRGWKSPAGHIPAAGAAALAFIHGVQGDLSNTEARVVASGVLGCAV